MMVKGWLAAGTLATVSLLMSAAAVAAGATAIRHVPGALAADHVYHAPRTPAAAGGLRYGVASDPVARWNKATGVKASLTAYYLSMASPVNAHYVSWAQAHAEGAEPVIEILPRGNVTLRGIIRGNKDRWLRQLRAQITSPVVISFAPEANGPWYTWGNQPQRFITAWRHVHRILGSKHITYLWQMSSRPSATKRSAGPRHKLAEFYPGAKFVSWIGFDGYFEFPSDTFGNVFGTAIHAIRKVTHRPVLLSETAVGPGVRHVARDITALIRNARSWKLLGLIWFDGAQHQPPYHQNWNLESRPRALRAFRKAVHG